MPVQLCLSTSSLDRRLLMLTYGEVSFCLLEQGEHCGQDLCNDEAGGVGASLAHRLRPQNRMALLICILG